MKLTKKDSLEKSEQIMEEKKNKEGKPSQNQIRIHQILKYATKLDYIYVVVGIIGSVISGIGWPFLTIFFGNVVTVFVNYEIDRNDTIEADAIEELETKFMKNVYLNSAMMFGVGIVFCVGNFMTIFFFQKFSLRQTRIIKKLYFDAILRQEVAWHDTQKSGEFASRISSDFKKFEMGINENLGLLIYNISTFFINLAVGFVYGWKLSLVILSLAPIMGGTGYIVTYLQAKLLQKEIQAHALASSAAEEAISAIRTVFAFNGQKKEEERYEKMLIPAMKNGCKRSFVTSFTNAANWGTLYSSLALGLWYGVRLIHEEPLNYDIGTVIIVFWSIIGCGYCVSNAAPYLESFQIGRAAAASIYQIIERKPTIDSFNQDGRRLNKFNANIEFRNVHFCYPTRPDVKILNGLNIHIRRGEIVALVGSSGCGKSTTIQLLQRFYDSNDGDVFLDDVNIKDLNIGWLREQFGVVGQEPVLFDFTIEENIRLGLPLDKMQTVSMEEIENAAEQANAHEFIKRLPDGYNTYVGERGTQLSGGQKQRIAIARALISKPKILLLDEATSALDMKSEHIVQAALDRASQGRTTIIVAHRLSTIINADRIIYIQNGQVLEMGTHEELMAKASGYYKLVCAQQVKDEGNKASIFNEEHHLQSVTYSKIGFFNPSPRGGSMTSNSSLIQINVDSNTELSDDKLKLLKQSKVPYGRLFRLIMKDKIYFIIAFISALIYGLVAPIYALIFGMFVDVFATISDVQVQTDESIKYAIAYLILAAGSFIVTILQTSLFGIITEKLAMRLRMMAYSAILRQEIAFFDQKDNNAGALCARMANDMANVQGATGMRIATICQAISTLIFSISIGFIYNPILATLALILMPLIAVASVLGGKLYAQQANEDSKSAQISSKLAIEVINGMRTVVSLHKENFFFLRFINNLNEHFKAISKKIFAKSLIISLSLGAPYASYAATFLLGGYLIKIGNLSSGDFFVIVESMVFGAIVVGQTAILSSDFAKAKLAAINIFRLIDQTPQKISNEENEMKIDCKEMNQNINGDIAFRGVHFNYPNRPELIILNGLSFSAKKGETVALVGESGCGKSTTIQLLERFYNPVKGKIYLDNQPVNDLDVDFVRSHVSLVQQEPILFSYSLRENIAYGDNSREIIPFHEIVRVAQVANIHDFIQKLPQGYDTPVGSKGAQLSGGQKQRVAIARALIRNPPILLLDEATSALDTESEKIVQAALDEASKGRTCIVIAHRLKTIVNADKIVVINKGVNVEEGTHEELVERKGFYWKLYNSALETTE